MILYVLSGPSSPAKTAKAQQLAGTHNAIIMDRAELGRMFRTAIDSAHLTSVLAENARFLLESGYQVVIEDWATDYTNEDLWYSIAEKGNAVIQWVHLAEG